VLGDIERIEVIRGPGAALWGANAVNGVVNIITRSARDTQGGYASLSAGSQDPAIAEARYGGTFAGGPAWRAYGKFADRDAQALASGASSGDAIRRGQGGFRVDGGSAGATHWLVKGDLLHSQDDLPDRPSGAYSAGALQARWSRPLSPASRLTVQSYYRHEYRRVPLQLTHHVDTLDLDAQHEWTVGRHALMSGGGFRVNADGTDGGTFRFEPAARTYRVGNVFGQDEITLRPDRLFLTIGAKVEHNAFSGREFQPNVRARLRLAHNQMTWAAMSRAVRRPTRFETDLIIPGPGGITLLQGSDAFEAESLRSLEAGYRVQPLRSLSIDVAAYRNVIHDLRSQEAPVAGIVPITIGNTLIGHAQGVETAVNFQPVARWRTHLTYTWLDTTIERASGSRDISGGVNEADDPHHLFGLRTSLDLPRRIEVDALLRGVSALPNPPVPAFTELSLRVGWAARRNTALWLAGQDLLHDHHPEFGTPTPARVEFERAIRAGISFTF
jgi:iron complex outermembrane recepter protein